MKTINIFTVKANVVLCRYSNCFCENSKFKRRLKIEGSANREVLKGPVDRVCGALKCLFDPISFWLNFEVLAQERRTLSKYDCAVQCGEGKCEDKVCTFNPIQL